MSEIGKYKISFKGKLNGSIWIRTFEIDERYAELAEERAMMLLSNIERSSFEETSAELFCPPAGALPPFNQAEWITIWDFQPK